MGALVVFPQGNPPPPIFQRPLFRFRGGLRGLGQEDEYYYYADDVGADTSYQDWYYGVDQWGAPTGANQNAGEASPIAYDWSEYDLWLYEQGYESPEQFYADQPASSDFAVPWDVPEFVPLTEEIVVPEEGFYGESINHLADIGILGTEEAAAVISGELDLQEALNISGYFGDYSTFPPAAQQAVADAQAKQDAAKKAQQAAGSSSGGGMSVGGGTPAQKAAQAQAAAAKTPAEIAAAQKAMAEANAAAGSWLEKDSVIKGVKNLYVVAGGAAALLLLGGRSGGGVSYTTISAPRAPRKSNPHRRHRRNRRRR